jgi:hypothetical protein
MGARRMPWRRTPTKDAASRDSPRGGASILRSGGVRMGEPARGSARARRPSGRRGHRGNGNLAGPRGVEINRDRASSGERKRARPKPARAAQPAGDAAPGLRGPESQDRSPGARSERREAAERHGKAGRSGRQPRTRSPPPRASGAPSRPGHVKPGPKLGGPPSKAEHDPATDSERVP